MKFNAIAQTITLLVIIASSIANAQEIETTEIALFNLPSSPIVNNQSKKLANDELLSCKTDFAVYNQIITGRSPSININKHFPDSLKYLNEAVRATYNTMRSGVIRHVTLEVALSLFNFSVDGFAPESIAGYVSDGTKPFLPFEFANGVKITKVTTKGGTIIYKAVMPITKNHSQAVALALAGRASAKTTVCNDMELVDDLLGREIVIQYDYYDSNGDFFSSFSING